MHRAAKKGNTAKLEALLNAGAEVNIADVENRTALLEAASAGQAQAVRLLLKHGADVNARHKQGITALMAASLKGRTEVVRLLLAAGADLKAKCEFGQDALCYASQERYGAMAWRNRWKQGTPKHPETIQVLLDAGASPATSACFIDPDYMSKAPRSIAILPVQDLREPEERMLAPDLARELPEALEKEFKPRRYEILSAVEAREKLGIKANADSTQPIAATVACSSVGTDAILQLQLLGSHKSTSLITETTGVAATSCLTDCKSGSILWKDFGVYSEQRGFIVAKFVSGVRAIASEMVTQVPPRREE
ncbi:MAG: ankyrin repeat domain-containing protein [Bryobacteraceae bacterium]